jgi:hypothetical protein
LREILPHFQVTVTLQWPHFILLPIPHKCSQEIPADDTDNGNSGIENAIDKRQINNISALPSSDRREYFWISEKRCFIVLIPQVFFYFVGPQQGWVMGKRRMP